MYWRARAILHEDILIEFSSSKHPIRLDAGNCLLFALDIRHRRTGKDDLIFARVTSRVLRPRRAAADLRLAPGPAAAAARPAPAAPAARDPGMTVTSLSAATGGTVSRRRRLAGTISLLIPSPGKSQAQRPGLRLLPPRSRSRSPAVTVSEPHSGYY